MMRRNILVVDDDPLMQNLLRLFLEQAGFNVRVRGDGYSALDELQSNPYDLVVLDITMPFMNGFKTLKKIRSSPSFLDLPVMMLTGNQNADSIVEAKKNHVTDYLIKPPSREAFLKRVELILGGRPQFETVELTSDELLSVGQISLSVQLKSVSRNGFILTGPTELPRGHQINISELGLFKSLGISRNWFEVMHCCANPGGKYDYFFSFFDLPQVQRERIHRWVMDEAFRSKRSIAAA